MTRIEKEKKTVGRMIAIYCKSCHTRHGNDICDDCRDLLDYACQRLDHCPKGNSKSSCRKCEIHCYSPAYREKIRAVMRHAGPRMILIHPVDAIMHLISELK